jgi:hypothetical protein
MKKQALTMIALMVLVGSLTASAKAQSLWRVKLVANIPFEFSAGDRTMPPGEYIVRCINPDSDQAILQIRSKDGRNGVLLQMTKTRHKASETATLVFHRYGDHYFFAQAWTPGERDGFKARKSRYERTVARELAGIKPATKAIALIANR